MSFKLKLFRRPRPRAIEYMDRGRWARDVLWFLFNLGALYVLAVLAIRTYKYSRGEL